MEPGISLACAYCDKPFEKVAREHRRQLKKGKTHFYCRQSCQVSAGNKMSPRGDGSGLVADNRRDALTPFRWYILRARQRKHTYDIDAAYLLVLWEHQGGVCAFTGWELRLPKSTVGWSAGHHPANASLDRIDCSKGYVEGNVRFISVMANYARNQFTDEQVLEFCCAVVCNT